jgi:hypothetical protein
VRKISPPPGFDPRTVHPVTIEVVNFKNSPPGLAGRVGEVKIHSFLAFVLDGMVSFTLRLLYPAGKHFTPWIICCKTKITERLGVVAALNRDEQ